MFRPLCDYMREGINDSWDLGCVFEVLRNWALDNKGIVFGHSEMSDPWHVYSGTWSAPTPITTADGDPLTFDSINELMAWLLNDATDCRMKVEAT